MKKLQIFFDNKLIIFLFLISPIIDVITGLMTLNGCSITIGMILKLIQLFFAVGYVMFCDKKNGKKNILFLVLLALLFCLNIYNNFDVFKSHTMSYMNYIFKFNYFAIMILYFYRYLNNKPNISIRLLCIPIIIFAAFILLSNITNTAFLTYSAPRIGNSSWYFSGNEYSSNICILFPIVIYIFIDRIKPNAFNLLIFLIFTYGAIFCGTKASLIALFGSLLFYILYKLIKVKKEKLGASFLLCILILTGIIINIKQLPTIVNVGMHINNVENSGVTDSKNKYLKIFFSDRDIFLSRIEKYGRDTFDSIVGRVYIHNGAIDIIESDIFDVYYMYGIVGFILIYGLFFYLIFKQLKFYFKNFKKVFYDSKYALALLSVGFVAITSLITGHTISSPSVAVYVAFILAKINVFKDSKCNGKSILYAYEYNLSVKKLLKEKQFDSIVIATDNKKILRNKNIEIIFKNNNKILGVFNIIKRVFSYYTGKIKYSKSYMIYKKDKTFFLAKLCYISSMDSVLLITEENYNKLSKIEKYKYENDNFQRIKEIKE